MHNVHRQALFYRLKTGSGDKEGQFGLTCFFFGDKPIFSGVTSSMVLTGWS